MTVFVFDKISDSEAASDSFSAAFSSFLSNGDSLRNDLAGSSVSPNGLYVAGGTATDTIWVAKINIGSPTKVLDAHFEATLWSNDAVGDQDKDMVPFAVDDEGFVWGESYLYGTTTDFPLGARTHGILGYIDPASPSAITRAISWIETDAAVPSDGYNIAGIFTFTMADGSIEVVVFPSGQNSTYVFRHVKGTSTYTAHTTGGSWFPSWCFQDSNKDIWVCGTDHSSPNSTVSFMRLTSNSTAYPTPQTITVPPTKTYTSSPIGYFASGSFIGGWQGDVAGPSGGTYCGTLFKIALDGSETVTSADVSAAPLRLSTHPSPPNPTYYLVVLATDTVDGGGIIGVGNSSRIFYNLQTDLTLGTSWNLDQWSAGDTGNDPDPTQHYDDVYTLYWAEGRQAFIGFRYQYINPDGSFDSTYSNITADLFVYYFGTALPDGEGDGTTATDSLTVRSWGFSLDGHDYYVLRLGDSGSLVYDLTTGQWAEWISPGRTNWRPHVGQNWKGLTAISTSDGETEVVCGDDATGTLWRLNVAKGRDERATQPGTDDKITKVATGGLQVTGRDVLPCGAVQLDLALGKPTQAGASVQLEISEDLGHNWVNCGAITVPANDYSTVVEWRALGLIRKPGRLFRITDDGATARIGGLNLR